MSAISPSWPEYELIPPDEQESVADFLTVCTPDYLQQNSYPEFIPQDTKFIVAGEKRNLFVNLILTYTTDQKIERAILRLRNAFEGKERVVYKCYDLFSGDFYATKCVTAPEHEFLKRANGSPGIPANIGFYKTDDQIYVIERFYPYTLDSVLQETKLIKLASRISVIVNILQGFAVLHSHEHAHLDLKPNNILLDHHFAAVISDFSFSDTIQANRFFLSPEWYALFKEAYPKKPSMESILHLRQVHGQAMDIWSAGVLSLCVLSNSWSEKNIPLLPFILAAFKPAMQDDSYCPEKVSFTQTAIQGTLEKINKFGSIATLIGQMLALDPQERPSASTCIEVLKALPV